MLDPDARALIDLLVRMQVPPSHTLPPPELRRGYRERCRLTQHEPPPLHEMRPQLAPGWSALVARCLRKDPHDRLHDALYLDRIREVLE